MSQPLFPSSASPVLRAGDDAEPCLRSFAQALAASLMVVGVIMAFSSGSTLDRSFWPDQPLTSTALRQGLFAAAAAVAMWMSTLTGYRALRWRHCSDGQGPLPWW